MTAEQIVLAALKASPAVLDIVGQGDRMRIWPDEATQGDPVPYIVFERIGSTPATFLDGEPAAAMVSMMITCWGKGRGDAARLAGAVEAAMRAEYHVQTDRTGEAVHVRPDEWNYAEALAFDIWEIPPSPAGIGSG